MEDFVRTLGIRAAPRVITFAVYDSAERAVLNIEDIKVPIAFEAPDALSTSEIICWMSFASMR
jgi:hypothetical protein